MVVVHNCGCFHVIFDVCGFGVCTREESEGQLQLFSSVPGILSPLPGLESHTMPQHLALFFLKDFYFNVSVICTHSAGPLGLDVLDLLGVGVTGHHELPVCMLGNDLRSSAREVVLFPAEPSLLLPQLTFLYAS